MDKENKNTMNKEGEKNMSAVAKEPNYKKLSLSPEKLKDITVKPVEVKNGKLIFDKNDKDHRYIVEGE